MRAATIRQTVTLPAAPRAVYRAWMSSKQHAAFTGDAARISRTVGGPFSTYGGYAAGRNLALEPGRRIVQSWRASDWPEGVESKLTVRLAKVRGGTRLTFVQTGVPPDQRGSIAAGWKEWYWDPLRKYFSPS
jgi:uncharacterized protein YndB with AHSA1/START domain